MDNQRFADKYSLTEDEQLLRESVQEFAQQIIAPHAEEFDQHGCPFPADYLKQAADLGFLGLCMPEEYGGSGMSAVAQMILMEELAKVSAGFASTVQAHAGLGLEAFLFGGTEEQKRTWMAEAIRGEKFCSFALTEPTAGSDSGSLTTTATFDEDTQEWVLNGQKAWITNLRSGGFFVVAARTDPNSKGSHGISTFYVDSKAPGLVEGEPERKVGNRCSSSGPLFFNDCRIPKNCLIGEEGSGFKTMMKGLDMGRMGIAGISLGIAQDCYERSVAYANERVQFGQPIAKFQSISFKLADMAMKIDLARTMLYNACRMHDRGLDINAEAAAVKIFASEMCVWVAENAMQIHGGNGYSEGYVVERQWRDSKLQTIGEGTTEINHIVVSRKCLKGEY